MKLYTVVIHYPQMCMKEYGCCPKFGRKYPDVKRSIKILFHSGIVMLTSPFKFLTGAIFLHAHLQAVYYNCPRCMILVSLFWRWDVNSLTLLHTRSFFIGNLIGYKKI
jgi:triacylglycerol esterase/lipase EstA (alpha/beta hydrolase family)